MFSKKIPNNENEASRKSKTPSIKKDKTAEPKKLGFWAARERHGQVSAKQFRMWVSANKSLYIKHVVAIVIAFAVMLGACIALYATGRTQKDKYEANYDQVWNLLALDASANEAIPLFKQYGATNESPDNETAKAINETVAYLEMFQYVTDFVWNDFTISGFNAWVKYYQQWPQSTPEGDLRTKDNYLNTVYRLVTQMTTTNSPDIPLKHINAMAGFAKNLKAIDMNIYADTKQYSDAARLSNFSTLPLLLIIPVISWISIRLTNLQKNWLKQQSPTSETPKA